MGVELEKALAAATEKRLREHGQLQYFEAEAFARALEQETNRAVAADLSHMKIEMNLEDASRLAQFMRRAILLGA